MCLRYKENESHHDELEPEFSYEHFGAIQKSNGSSMRNAQRVLKNELFAFTNEAGKYHTDIGRNLLLLEPAVFREHSSNGLKSGTRSLPPTVPKVVAPPLKSCLKSNKQDQKSLSALSETPGQFSQVPSERYMSCGTFQSAAVTNSKMETDMKPWSNGPQTTIMATTHSTVKAVKKHFPNPDIFSWDDHQDMDYADEFKEHPNPQPANDTCIPEQIFPISTVPNTASSEEKVGATIPPENSPPEPAILRPISGHQTESEITNMLPRSGADTMVQEKHSDTQNASSPSDTVQRIPSTPSTLPPRYSSTSESWQEDKDFESSIPDECHTPPFPSPPRDHWDKTWGSDEEMFLTSLESEDETTRLIAEVIAVRSRLEDCKLKPLDYRNIFAGPQFPSRSHSRLEQHSRAEIILEENSSGEICTQPAENGRELTRNQKEQGIIEVTSRGHEIFRPEDDSHDDTKEFNLDEDYGEKEKKAESASNAADASSVDDHEKDELTTTHCGTARIDNFTEMHTFAEMEPRKILHGAAWEIPWKNEVVPTADAGCPGMKNDQPENSTVVSPFPCIISTPPKPVGSTSPVDFHSEKIKQHMPRGLDNQQPYVRHVLLQTDDDINQLGQDAQCHLKSECIPTNLVDLHGAGAESTKDRSDCSLLSTKRTSKYLNIGYRDLSEAPKPKYPKQHCFYSSHGLLQVGYSQPRQSPKTVKQNIPQNNRNGQPWGFHDSLGDKENYGISGSDDQELSILASLERLDWKLAAMSARVKNRTSITPSMVSQIQNSIQSAPAATGVKGAPTDGTPRRLPVHPLRPSVRCPFFDNTLIVQLLLTR